MKTSFLKHIPYFLTYSRLVIAAYYIIMCLYSSLQNPVTISVLLIYAILSDIFDGIIARRLKMDTVYLRQLDSKIDTVFWIALLFLLVVLKKSFMLAHITGLLILLASEICVQIFGYLKFKRLLALHTYTAKAWALLLMLLVLELLLGQHAEVIFFIAFVWGLLSQLEVTLIIFKLKTYKVDISSIFKMQK